MQSFRLYGTNIPEKGEYVNFMFTQRNDNELITFLTDYHIDGFMTYSEATHKKRVRSWNKITPLNKIMIGYVEEIIKLKGSSIVRLSMAYIDVNDRGYKNIEKYNSENKKLVSIFKKYCYYNELEIEDFWVDVIHKIDIKRREESELSLYEYVKENSEILKEHINDEYYDSIIKDFSFVYKPKNYTSRFGIICNGGVSELKEVFTTLFSEIEYPFSLKIETTPYYIFETNSSNTTEETHKEFIERLMELSKSTKSKTFVNVKDTCY